MWCSKNCTTIYNCYKYTDKEIDELSTKIIRERTKRKFTLTRTAKSYACEIRAHKRLYKLHLFRLHTKDADCEDPISKFKDILFRIIGG